MDDFEIVDLPVDKATGKAESKAKAESKNEKKTLQTDEAQGANQAIVRQLHELTKGLEMPSETDAPFHVFFWSETDDLTPEKIAEKAGVENPTPVETRSLNDVFDSNSDDEEEGDSKRFAELKKALQTNLKDLKIYAFGKRKIDLVIVGKTEGGYAGLTTYVVET